MRMKFDWAHLPPRCPLILLLSLSLSFGWDVRGEGNALTNPGFEEPAVSSGQVGFISGWSGSHLSTALASDFGIIASEGNQIARNDSPIGNNTVLFQDTVTIEANTIYNFQVDLQPLIDDPAHNSAGVELAPNPSYTGFLATAYYQSNNFSPGPFPTADDFTLTPGEWTRVLIGFDSRDYPEYVGETIRVIIRGHKLAVDNARLTTGRQDYFISSSIGNDSLSGETPETAWRTFSNLDGRVLSPGDQVLLKRGDAWPNSHLHLRGKGTAEEPILLSAYGEGPNPVITATNLTDAACITLENPSNFLVECMDCRDGKIGLYLRYTDGLPDGNGPGFNNRNVRVRGCTFKNFDEVWSDENGDIELAPPYELSWGAAIWIGGSIPNGEPEGTGSDVATVVEDVTVEQCAFLECTTGFGNGWYFPRRYKSRIRNLVLRDCFATGCENGGFALFYVDGGYIRNFHTLVGGTGFYSTGTTSGFVEGCQNLLIENCEFAFNRRNQTAADGVGFDFEGGCRNIVFQKNVLHDNDGAGLLVLRALDDPNLNLTIEGNVFYNNARNPRPTGDHDNNEIVYFDNPDSSGVFRNNGIYRGEDVGFGSVGLYHNGTDFISDFGGPSVLSTNRTGTNYSTVKNRPRSWFFETEGDLEGWHDFNQWDTPAVTNGSLRGTSTGIDPYASTAPCWIPAQQFETVRVRFGIS
ncbi:MAG: right-handed parallel beta-helix repeat-containing protein, partial [Candidatus Omnitrophica bacterium]|nr:right-handed parallel beta-helix repeat-containing protein [Candidatus Omnitrophota bacterium]